MTNLCTKVTVRQRKLAKGKVSLYLDYYPAIRHPRTGRMTRREYLGIYIYANPTERFQQEYNRSMMKKAELIKCRRTESVINEQFGFLDRAKGRESRQKRVCAIDQIRVRSFRKNGKCTGKTWKIRHQQGQTTANSCCKT